MTTTQPAVITSTEGVTITWELIDADLAEHYLGLNIDDNRKVDDRTVNAYERDMLSENWRIVPAGIGFNTDGRLIDGQHRLRAIVNSETVQELPVFRNIPSQAMRNIDQNRTRTVQDELYRRGAMNRRTLTSATRLLMAYEDNEVGVTGVNSTKYTNDEVLEYVDIWREQIEAAVPIANTIKRNITLAPSITCACHVLFSNKDRELSSLFFDSLSTGANLGPKDPVLALRNRLQRDDKDGANRTQAYKFYMLTRVWNAVRKGEQITRIYVPDAHTGRSMIAVL